jgi:hypothetical protein
MKMEEFLQVEEEQKITEESAVQEETVVQDEEIELDVQKAVVESLAAEKVECDERIISLEGEKSQLAVENEQLKAKVAELENKIFEYEKELSRVGDLLSANSETESSSKVSLLDRDVELSDRFIGETREQVLEVIKEARDKAEADGRIRRAQVLEGVLVANESTGELANKRAALEKFFNDNANILSGPVIAELERCGISYKNGEEYFLPAEILRRTY